MKCLFYFGIASMKEDTSAQLSGRGELHGGLGLAALLWSRRGGGHYELLWPPGEEDAEAVAEADEEDGTESKGDAEVTMGEDLAEEGPEKGGGGKRADGGAHVAGCATNTDPGGG